MFKTSKYNLVIESDKNYRTLLYNTVSGAVCWFNKDIYETILNASDLKPEEIPSEVKRLGYVVSKCANETDKLLFYKKRHIYNSTPEYLSYVIAPTLKCNYKCSYCFEKNATNVQTMSDQTILQVERFIEQEIMKYPSIKGIHVTWFGGEPCLQLKRIEKLSKSLIALTKSFGLKYHAFIVTNGFLFNINTAIRLKDICSVSEAQITLDGLSSTYSSKKGCDERAFEKVLKNIIDASNILKLHIRVNIDESNMSEIKPLIELLFKENQLSTENWPEDRGERIQPRSYSHGDSDIDLQKGEEPEPPGKQGFRGVLQQAH